MDNLTLEQFNQLLNYCDLTKKEFSEISKVPYGTIMNWGTSRGKMHKLKVPSWVEPFLKLYYENKKKPIRGKPFGFILTS